MSRTPPLRAARADPRGPEGGDLAVPTGEPEHWHADFRWLLRVTEPKVVLQAEEVDGYAWRPGTDAPTPKLAAKLATL